VEVEIKITNISNYKKENIIFLDNIQKPFLKEKSEIEKTR